MLMILKVVWLFIERWGDVIGIIIIAPSAILFTFHMIEKSDTALILSLCGKIALLVVGIVGFNIAIAYFDWRKLTCTEKQTTHYTQ